jgi:hypothetical protein
MKVRETVKMPEKTVEIERDLNALHADVMRVASKITGVAGILMKASTDESGILDLDPALNGVGHILEDCVEELGGINEDIGEHAVRTANLESALDVAMKENLLKQADVQSQRRVKKT